MERKCASKDTLEEKNHASTNNGSTDEEPGDDRSPRPAAPTGSGECHEKDRRAASNGRPRPPAGGPDQRLQLLRRHARPRPQKGGRDGRAPLRGGSLAGGSLLQRSRTRRTGSRRGGHTPERPADPVPDEVWEQAARHYDEPTLSALIIEIALINFWNRLTVTVRQPAGSYPG